MSAGRFWLRERRVNICWVDFNIKTINFISFEKIYNFSRILYLFVKFIILLNRLEYKLKVFYRILKYSEN